MKKGMKEQQARFYEGYRYKPRHVQPARVPARKGIDLDDINDEPGLRTVFIPAPTSPGEAANPRTVVRVTHHNRAIPPRTRARAEPERHTGDDQGRHEPAPLIRTGAGRWRRWLLITGATLLVMYCGYVCMSAALSWWQTWTDDMRYGRPRTAHFDAKVGHGDSITPSHFIAVNLNGRILVTEIAGADPTRSKIYVGPDIGDADIPVTLEFRDVGGDQRPDMLIRVNKKAYAFMNDTIDGKPQFRPPKEGETVNL